MAVVAVLLFHTGIRQTPGGFLGVSLFFTLSGFLITGLLIDEFSARGGIRVRAFWGRRVRRLLPAALLCLGLVLATSHWLIDPATVGRVRADVVAAAADVANWRFLTAHQSYAELFARQPSAVLHFWSLAIEEQFYLIYPCIVAVLVSRRRPWLLPVGLATMTVASIACSFLTTDHDVIYYGTHTRAAELLIGGMLAWLMSQRSRIVRPPATARRRMIGQAAAFSGAAIFAALVIETAQSDAWLYRGGFALLSVLWCVLIVASRSAGQFCTILSLPPLVALGRRSYGVYLFHWPVFTLITPDRIGWHGWQARLIQIAIIAAMTEVSYRLIERPIRQRKVLTSRRISPAIAFACVSAVIAGALVVPTSATGAGAAASMIEAPDDVVHLLPPTTTRGAGARAATGNASAAAAATPPTPPAPPPFNVVVVGSAAQVVTAIDGFRATGANLHVTDLTLAGCSVILATRDGVEDSACLPDVAEQGVTDLLVIGVGQAEHTAMTNVLAVAPGESGEEQYSVSQTLRLRTVEEFDRLATRAARVLIVDTLSDSDFLAAIIDEAILSSPAMTRRFLADLQPADIGAPTAASTAASTRALKVMVIGDSTSYGMAQGLAQSAAGTFDVLWAGRRNCPVARMEATQILTEQVFSMKDCPSVTSVWPEQIALFRPDVVLVVDALPEQSLQQYAGDATWFQAGDPQFMAVHDADFRALLDLVADVGAVIVLAQQPHEAADKPATWATAERIDAWNSQLASWDQLWAPVTVLPYGSAIEAAEAAAGHTLRPDGLHLDEHSVGPIISEVIAAELIKQVTELEVTLVASSCLVRSAQGAALDLSRCATAAAVSTPVDAPTASSLAP